MNKTLASEIQELEEKLGLDSPDQKLAHQIRSLEETLAGMGYMDETYMDEMDDALYMDDEDNGILDEVLAEGVGESAYMEKAMYYMQKAMGREGNIPAAEEDELVELDDSIPSEKRINQDFLDELADMLNKKDLSDANSMIDITNTDQERTDEYRQAMTEASMRLDRVASYVEDQGNTKFALALDKLADQIDKNTQG